MDPETAATPEDTTPVVHKSSAITVSNSSRHCFKRCHKQFEYRYIRRLESTAPQTALAFGILWHETMDAAYESTEVTDDEIRAFYEAKAQELVNELPADFDAKKLMDTIEMGRQMLRYFLEEIKPNDDFEMVATEVSFRVKLINPATGHASHTTFVGRADGIIERNGTLYLREYKTAADLRTDHLILDDQVADYLWALRQTGVNVQGVCYDIFRKVNPYSTRSQPPYHYREYIYRSDAEIEERGKELYAEAQLIRAATHMGLYDRNPTRDCGWDCGFRSMCIAEKGGGDGDFLMGTTYQVSTRKR